jgi:hypothetical protein
MTSQPPLAPDRLARRKEHLMNEILTPVADGHPVTPVRPRRRLGFAVAAFVVVLLTVGITLTQTIGGHSVGLGPTAFAVTPAPHGQVSIRVVSTQASAEQMTDQLHRKGIDISVTTIPAVPALVGVWLTYGSATAIPAKLVQHLDQYVLGKSVTIVLPANVKGAEFDIGRATKPGEAPVVGGFRNALSPGAPLACKSLSGTTPAAAQTILTSLGYTITGWTTSFNPIISPRLSELPAGRVTEAFIDDLNGREVEDVLPGREHDVIVQVTPKTSTDYAMRIHQGFSPTQPLNTC